MTPQVLGAPALVTTIEPKPTSRGPVTPARTGPHVPGPGSPGRTNPGLSPCLASLWPRRSGPRPRTSLGGCGSWFSVQRHRTPEIRLSVTGILAALQHARSGTETQTLPGQSTGAEPASCGVGVRLTSFKGAEWERGGEWGGSGSGRERRPRGFDCCAG